MKINEVNISEFGMKLWDAKGLSNIPKLKNNIFENNITDNGLNIGLAAAKMEARNFTTEFLLTAVDMVDFEYNIENLKNNIFTADNNLCTLEFTHTSGIHQAYMKDSMKIRRLNSINSDIIYGKITINWVEPSPNSNKVLAPIIITTGLIDPNTSVSVRSNTIGELPVSYEWYVNEIYAGSASDLNFEITATNFECRVYYVATYENDSQTQSPVVYININQSKYYDFINELMYDLVTIGNQQWLVENLKSASYNDGSNIPLITGNTAWANDTSGGRCYPYGNINNVSDYGYLYNFAAINTGKLAPEGLSIPSEEDWNELISYLGGDSVAGGKLKESGLNHWDAPNIWASDDYGFSARGAGYRDEEGFFQDFKILALFASDINDWIGKLSNAGGEFDNTSNSHYGISVRCFRYV